MRGWTHGTADQRWSSGLIVGLSCALLLFGWPNRAVVATQASPPVALPGPTTAPSPAPSPTAPQVPAPTVAVPSGAVPHDYPPSPVPSGNPPPPPVVALVPGDASGVNQQTLAQLYLPTAVVVDAGAAGACSLVPAGTRLAVSSADLAPDLSACLHRRGIVVVAFASDSQDVLSTRRTLAASVLDQAPLLAGRVGIVGRRSDAAALASATKRLQARGVTVVSTVLLDDSTPTDRPGVLSGIFTFTLARVDTVLFAASVGNQSLWGTVAGTSFHYVIADASDAIVDESYPAAFEGARARTTQRGSWWVRRHGASPVQRACLADARVAGTTGAAQRAALLWCGLSLVVRQATAVSTHRELADVVSALRVPSPVTSDLGPVDGGWGPAGLATVTWRSSCGCFLETTPFKEPAK